MNDGGRKKDFYDRYLYWPVGLLFWATVLAVGGTICTDSRTDSSFPPNHPWNEERLPYGDGYPDFGGP